MITKPYEDDSFAAREDAERLVALEKAQAHAGSPSQLRVAATLVADGMALAVSAVLAVALSTFVAGLPGLSGSLAAFDTPPPGPTGAFLLLTPYWLAALWAFGQYREPARSIGGMHLTSSLGGITALTSAAWLLLIVLALAMGGSAPLLTLVMFWANAAVLIPLCRWLSSKTVWSAKGFRERTLIIGAGSVGQTVAAKMANHPDYCCDLVGFLDDGQPRAIGTLRPPARVLGALGDLERVVREERIHRVIVAFSQARHEDFLRVIRACADAHVQVNIVPRLFEVVSSRALVDDIEGIALLDIGHAELGRFSMAAKRAFDLIVGGLISVVALPVIVLVALIIRLDSRGSVFFRQERMGRGGSTFLIYKFRSMYDGAEGLREELSGQNEYSGPMFKIHEDPRVTRVGRWLRRWSIDELPQIFNVLRGDMSLVGPRPLWVHEAEQCTGWTQKRLDITPGITGLWQVLGRSEIPFEEMVKLDYMYVTSWSMSWDIKLLLQTLPAVLQKRGAY